MSIRACFGAACALAVAFAAQPAGQTPPAPAVVALVGGTVIDGTGAAPRPSTTIIITGDRITRIGPSASTPPPAGAQIIQAAGKFVVPGFIDAHVHYRDYYAELFATHGITSVVDWGGSPIDWLLAQRDGVAKGRLFGPRIFTGGEMIGEGTDVKGAIEQVHELAKRGVDKIDLGFGVSAEVASAVIAEARRLGLPTSGYPIHTRAAIEAGISAIKHTYTVGIANVTDPERLRKIEHQLEVPERSRDAKLFLLDDHHDDLVRLMLTHHVAWVPTLVKDMKVTNDRRDEFERDNVRLLSNPELQYLPVMNLLPQITNQYDTGIGVVASGMVGTVDPASADYQTYRRGYRALQDLIKKLVAGGGHVLAGTAPHSFVLPGLSLHHEMQLLVDAGLTPSQAMQAAGVWAAEYVHKDQDLGTLAEGKLGDVVVLGRNPLENIANTRSVEVVLQGGRVQPLGYHRTYTNPIPRMATRGAPGEGYPRPQLDQVSPGSAPEGGAATTLTVKGKSFVRGSTVIVDRFPLETTYISATELRAVLPERVTRLVGSYPVIVSTPRPGGGDSTPLAFIVTYR